VASTDESCAVFDLPSKHALNRNPPVAQKEKAMTTQLVSVPRAERAIASYTAHKDQTRLIVAGLALAVVIALAAIAISAGTNTEVDPADTAGQVQTQASVTNWAAPATDAAGIEYSPANPYAQPETASTPLTRPGQHGPS
jgi:hypothetical protein